MSIYFLVNNTLHLCDAALHARDLAAFDKHLLAVPHALDLSCAPAMFASTTTFSTPFRGRRSLLHPLRAWIVHRAVRRALRPTAQDTLIAYTEYELLNHHIIHLFHSRGSRVLIIEEGLSTYLIFGKRHPHPLTPKQTLREFWIRYVLGYTRTRLLPINGIPFPVVSDHTISALLTYLPVPVARSVRTAVVQKPLERLRGLHPSHAVFLNERIYDYYISLDEYLVTLRSIVAALSHNFPVLYFKFHPREGPEDKRPILDILKDFPGLTIVQEHKPIETLVYRYRPKYAVSFFSAALLNLAFLGIEPVYVFHLVETLRTKEMFKDTAKLLRELGYSFPRALRDVNPAYRSMLTTKTDSPIRLSHVLQESP